MGAQLADLQQQLARAHAAHPSPRWSSSSDTPAAASNFASPSFVVGASAIDDPLGKRREDVHPRGNMVPLDETVYSRSYVYAQRSLGHVGEFIGRGSILCALHSVSSKSTARMLYACSTQSVECPIEYPGLGILLDHLPPRDGLDSLLDYYFANVNWRFGIPEKWFRDGYVDMANEKVAGSRINPNWLALLFAVLACVPSSASYLPSFHNYVHEPRKYHAHAKEACRMASAGYLDLVPLDQSLMASAADGAVLRCFAMTLLCTYLAENGYVSEAWKLTGSAIRLAESVGMHRDPSWALWQAMSVDESTLRRRSWWNLLILDKLYSYALGRPQMIRSDMTDIKFPDEVSTTPGDAYETRTAHLLRLCLIMGEAMEKCFSLSLVPGPAVYELDEKFKEWRRIWKGQASASAALPCAAQPPHAADTYHTLGVWDYAARMKLHHAFVTRGMQPETMDKTATVPTYSAQESRGQCLWSASRLIDLYCNKYEQGGGGALESLCLLYEAAVTVISMMNQTPAGERNPIYEQTVERAYTLFQDMAGQEGQTSRTPQLALWTLEQLMADGCWRAPQSGTPSRMGVDRGAMSSPRLYILATPTTATTAQRSSYAQADPGPSYYTVQPLPSPPLPLGMAAPDSESPSGLFPSAPPNWSNTGRQPQPILSLSQTPSWAVAPGYHPTFASSSTTLPSGEVDVLRTHSSQLYPPR